MSRGSELPPTLPLTYFEWEVRPLFYPRDAHDRTERAGVSVALERGGLIGPFALITQFPLDSPYPFQRRQHLRPDQLTEAIINWDSGFESLTSARLRHTRPDSNPLGHRVEVNPYECWGRLADLTNGVPLTPLGRHLPSSLSEVARRCGRSKSLGGCPLPRLAKSINSPAPRRSRGTYPPARHHRRCFGIRATASGIQHPSIRLWRARHRRPHPHPHGRSEPHPAPRGPTPKATGKVIEH